jgi:hypothetical protein
MMSSDLDLVAMVGNSYKISEHAEDVLDLIGSELSSEDKVMRPFRYRHAFFGSATPCASPPPRPTIFSDDSFLVHHPVNGDDWPLLARAMASESSVTWQHCTAF